MEKKGYLLLANGRLFEGVLRGAEKSVTGEAVFTTSVVGYLGTLTDPSYAGQIVVQTFPAIGNYGVIPEDLGKEKAHLAGYVAREICDDPSNFRCEGQLNDYLVQQGIPCLTDVDTRALTRCIRNHGAMNAMILTEKPEGEALEELIAKLQGAPVFPAVEETSVDEVIPAEKPGRCHVAVWDFGAKDGLVAELVERGCGVTVVPASATAEEILKLNADGVLLSSGAGDPRDCSAVIEQLQVLCRERVPMFGVGLGHQLLALANGATVSKLPYGHRGGNQPAKDVKTGLCYMTGQHHGYVVDIDTLPGNASLRFINGNDGTCEGVDYTDIPAFSVQFHPEKGGGPLDTRFLFDRFIALMGGNKACR